ncbi:mycothiol synthase [Dactylosporangium matsuzakiense]|uniref:Mycothiol acetyltransferase n=1 Tax=Dactylosporangium matsuzakiense TaxID=53360 RepID=A0A9W6KJ38_9ACTN|nr:mycothiol synthase [Dactylosporangium matsuzakiense]UWZ45542.1 mycothiol synthase [Dactylosporangium matsuzakiense]GLL00459.1 mycothiol acetyltransferase [Dactylosporangium matsuzakiense]
MTPVHPLNRLSPEQVEQVLALARAADDTDGTAPLSEQVMLHLDRSGTHLVVEQHGHVVGYAQIDDDAAELVIHPLHRRRGLGRALAAAVLAARGDGDLKVWAHGDHPSASALAIRLHFDRARVLLQLRRSLSRPLADFQMPAGVLLRAFVPGEDDERWLALNSAAFAEHPEQGRWTLDDLRLRLAEPWFDPAGFLLAERDGELVGFHWTKVHPGPEPIGEVYVLGVAPGAHGGGLGRALTLAGLHHLRSRGLAQVMLYVDEDNPRAVALYRGQGFVRWTGDVQYRRGH